MVYIYIDNLPQLIKQKLNYTQDITNPSNYITFKELKLTVDDYNANKVDSDKFLMHKIVGSNIIMDSDLQALKYQWEADHRPAEILKEIKEREIRCQDRNFIQKSNSITKGMFKPKTDESVKEYEKSMNFGLSFIFSIFASALLGYYFGLYFLQLPQDQCFVLAILFLMGGLLLETSLYIVKIMKDDKINQMRKKQSKKSKVSSSTNQKQKYD